MRLLPVCFLALFFRRFYGRNRRRRYGPGGYANARRYATSARRQTRQRQTELLAVRQTSKVLNRQLRRSAACRRGILILISTLANR